VVERPLEDVVRAMQIYYHDTNYHGNAYAVTGTNEVPGVSYTLMIGDCAFDYRIGGLLGDMVATRVSTDSTKLQMIVKSEYRVYPTNTINSVKKTIARTLEQVAKIAERKQ
jgi:hypothetical protein